YTIVPPSADKPMGETIWNDQAAEQRVANLKPLGNGTPNDAGDWRRGQFVNLAAWQEYLRSEKILAADSAAASPAEDVLRALASFEPQMDELRAAAARPSSRFPIHYYDHVGALLPHLGL